MTPSLPTRELRALVPVAPAGDGCQRPFHGQMADLRIRKCGTFGPNGKGISLEGRAPRASNQVGYGLPYQRGMWGRDGFPTRHVHTNHLVLIFRRKRTAFNGAPLLPKTGRN